jgi:uncharacterized surface protein with fasciclin (FAS1) repeats
MKAYKYIMFACVGSLALSACDDPFEGDTFVTPTDVENEMTCTTLMEKRSDDFSMWIDLLKYADYYNGLKDASATATVFAPTNKAIQEFLEWRGVSSIQELDKTYAREVVQNHIISGIKIGNETFINAAADNQALTTQCLFLSYLKPTFGHVVMDVDDAERTGDTLNIESVYINNQAIVQPRDSGGINSIEASNAIIYYMDDVIRPLSEPMVSKLESEGQYTIFAAACRESGYDKVVEQLRDTVYIRGGGYSVTTYQFTCFAPSDDAMKAAGINSLDDLKNMVGTADSALYKYCAYHFLNSKLSKSEFLKYDTDDQVLIYDTNNKGNVITAQHQMNADSTFVTDSKGEMVTLINEKAKIIRSDIEARNGMIHKIDYVMPVWVPKPVTIKWDFCNTDQIIRFANAYGASKKLGDLYSTAMTNKEYQIDLTQTYRDGQFGEIDSTTFTYQANSTRASYGNYRAIGFFKNKYYSSKQKTINHYRSYLNNLLFVNLGYAGWVQFKTPTIIKGKYKVTLHYASNSTMSKYHAAGSLTKFQIDPEANKSEWSKNAYVFKGLPANTETEFKNYWSSEVCKLDLWVGANAIEFTESGSHKLKVTMLDINAKTGNTYHQMWDYILFEPITE